MRNVVCVILLMVVALGCNALAETNSLIGLPYDSIVEQWGNPIKSYPQLKIWNSNGMTLVASFSYSIESETSLLTEYAIFNEERRYISGTIQNDDTLFHVYDVISSTPAIDIPHVFDSGSGFVINTKITADGYIVRWRGDCPNVITDMYIQVYDCIEQQYTSGRILEYLFYLMMTKH